MNLNGAVALVTGGSLGIGYAIAESLKREGALVTITGRNAERLAAAASTLGVDSIHGDVGSEADVVRTVGEVVEKHGRLDILVNNAGFGAFKPLVDMTLDDMESVYRTNVFGAFLMAREAAKQFVKQDGGELINISSTAGRKGFKGGTAYASSKFALSGMNDCWRDELRPHNVRVTLVNPSEVVTNFAASAGYEQSHSPKKLVAGDIADAITGFLKIEHRGFVPEFSVWATNPF
jgi:3-oxoacyl-[acyl-carrier protein] reductase